jgi:uncharacterized membrane protein YjjB (DUF3815 family)
MEPWIEIFSNAFWCGCAGLGFAILFNTPRTALVSVWLCGFMAGLIKFAILSPGVGAGMLVASWLAASAVGFASIPFAHWCHVPPIIVSIPAVIPLVPGSFAYRTMLGLIKFINDTDESVLTGTIHNASMTLFILMALSIGVTLPMLLFRIESVKHVRMRFPWGDE